MYASAEGERLIRFTNVDLRRFDEHHAPQAFGWVTGGQEAVTRAHGHGLS
ncbi:hypothetical protein [Pseudorhodoferax sp.]|nr:hypothetical protein [Pseudorhodoferax sp.]